MPGWVSRHHAFCVISAGVRTGRILGEMLTMFLGFGLAD
jgi:hypothetical protein